MTGMENAIEQATRVLLAVLLVGITGYLLWMVIVVRLMVRC